eukprot:gb/GECG01015890.1/.p1 GENE.gb/GECG01015890.1/~~gb/GECG01015890.1/.p1  ORF type:complete len:147 (+),score=20.59 gb/GECG01015890.1/:1-441(+)
MEANEYLASASAYLALHGAALASSGLQANKRFETIIDPPLKTCESTDHQNTRDKTAKGKVEEAVLFNDGTNTTTGLLVQLRDNGIRCLRYNGTQDTSGVSGKESDKELRALGVALLGGSENECIESFDHTLEGSELHHGIRNLTSP